MPDRIFPHPGRGEHDQERHGQEQQDQGAAGERDLEQQHGQGQPQRGHHDGDEGVEGTHERGQHQKHRKRGDKGPQHWGPHQQGKGRDDRQHDQCRHQSPAKRKTVIVGTHAVEGRGAFRFRGGTRLARHPFSFLVGVRGRSAPPARGR